MTYKEAVEMYKQFAGEVKALKKDRKDLYKKSKFFERACVNGVTVEDRKEAFESYRAFQKSIRVHEKLIFDYGRKCMHFNIALSLYRGTPYEKILAKNTKKKIRSESVLEFLRLIN